MAPFRRTIFQSIDSVLANVIRGGRVTTAEVAAAPDALWGKGGAVKDQFSEPAQPKSVSWAPDLGSAAGYEDLLVKK